MNRIEKLAFKVEKRMRIFDSFWLKTAKRSNWTGEKNIRKWSHSSESISTMFWFAKIQILHSSILSSSKTQWSEWCYSNIYFSPRNIWSPARTPSVLLSYERASDSRVSSAVAQPGISNLNKNQDEDSCRRTDPGAQSATYPWLRQPAVPGSKLRGGNCFSSREKSAKRSHACLCVGW